MMGDDGVIIHIGAITSVSKFGICKGEDDEKNVVIKVNRYSVDLCICLINLNKNIYFQRHFAFYLLNKYLERSLFLSVKETL